MAVKFLLFLLVSGVCLASHPAAAAVHVYAVDSNGVPWLRYQCDAGETVRSFALDVSVDRGEIIGVSNFFTGLSTATAQGFGVFPASFRDHVTVSSATAATWTAAGYSPVAPQADAPAGTLPGLGSSGVTLEFGALWDPTVPAARPPQSGILCSLQVTAPAKVTITANTLRGGIVASPPDETLTPVFAGALVGPAIQNISMTNRTVTVLFQDGELQTAPSLTGPWTGTGNRTGWFTELPGTSAARFYRVYNH